MKQFIRHPRQAWKGFSHRKKIMSAVGAGALILATGAFALYVVTVSGSGTSPNQTLGNPTNAALTVNVYFTSPPANGLTPNTSEPINSNIVNNSGQTVSVNAVSYAVTTGSPTCLPSWFTVTTGTYTFPASIDNGDSINVPGTLSFNDSGTNQNACAGTTVAVTSTIS